MDTASISLWLSAAGLGVFHGLNPAMGWLFAVALGLYAHSRRVLLLSLMPIAIGHAAAIGLVLTGTLALGALIDHASLNRACGAGLIGWGIWRMIRGHRGRPIVGMRTGLAGLALWSFLMSSAHGAGLMLIPVLLPLCSALAPTGLRASSSTQFLGMIALCIVHTLAMLAAIAVISLVVYQRAELGFLRLGWINIDRVWSIALLVCGAVLLVLPQ